RVARAERRAGARDRAESGGRVRHPVEEPGGRHVLTVGLVDEASSFVYEAGRPITGTGNEVPMSFQRIFSLARKETIHMLRDPATMFFALAIPIIELLLLGYAIDTNVRDVRTVVLDQAQTQESRQLIREFKNSTTFFVVEQVATDWELTGAIVAGRARVGVKIPEDYSRRLLAGQTAQLQILVDGSESSTAGTTGNVGN